MTTKMECLTDSYLYGIAMPLTTDLLGQRSGPY
jgi:hypothetical protein